MQVPRILLALAGLLLSSSAALGLTLFQGATVLTMEPGAPPYAPGWFTVDDAGYLVAVGEGHAPPDQRAAVTLTVDLSGRIVLPGFVSGHSHLWQSAFRGIAPAGELWPWLDALHRSYGDAFAPGDLDTFTTHGAVDQLRHGITTTYNHSHWLEHDFGLYREQFTASNRLPQRFVFAVCVPLEEPTAVWREQLASFGPVRPPHPRRSMLGLALNLRPYGPPENIARQVDFARAQNLPIQMHYLEQSARAELDRAAWPGLVAAGVVAPHTTFAHFIHPTSEILTEAAAAGASMIWNPLSNGRLGSGLADIPGYLGAGLRLGMGVDGQASADISDPFENMRLGLYALRMRAESAGGLQPIDMLRLHTLATAQVLGLDEYVGSLRAGKFADFLVVDPTRPATGPVWDVAAHLVFASSAANLEAVYIGGRPVVVRGEIPGHDPAALSAHVAERLRLLRQRHNTP